MKRRLSVPFVPWLASGIVAGLVLDCYLVAVLGLLEHLSPITLQQWFASNAIGMRAFSGGMETALLGLGLHLCVSLAWAAAFIALTTWLPPFARIPATARAFIFGVAVFIVMQFIAVPLGASPKSAPAFADLVVSAAGIIAAFSLPLVLIAARVSPSTSR